MCAFFQRKSSAVTQATPFARCSGVGGFMGRQVASTVGVGPSIIGWSRRGDAACDLEVVEPVLGGARASCWPLALGAFCVR